ncbi:hypothetical protein N7537_010728 [Penicillium hordei]|uniref:Uncharacterized protein n=1 Tax=Penicillium hordei TaxID=40994 RepID=A0AAD6DKE2_9EURO|nr:uncharacterized protein N7537_010728 [Penicillium hordei]KAJ5588050.1 hypothetical protein N7537_010728 [Penicillium hordei]
MAPLVPIFSADSLPDHVNTVRRNFQEKRRKGEQVNLKDCPLLEMTQFSCNPPQNGVPEPGVVVCEPVVRLFRRKLIFRSCAGGLMVETTSWEPTRLAEEAKQKQAANTKQ